MSSPSERINATANHLAAPAEDSPLAMAFTSGEGKIKLYDSAAAPNPRLVRLIMHEKGITGEIENIQVNLAKADNRKPPYTDLNFGAQVPSLQLPDGTVVAEVTVICELLEDLFPNRGPNLVGKTAVERAVTRMWCRRIDYKVAEFLFAGFRYAEGFKMFNSRMKLLPETAPQMKAMAQEGTRFFDAWLAKSGTPYLQGNEPMLSDFWLFTVLHFGRTVKQPVNPDCKNVAAWMKRMEERASIKAVKA